MRTIKRWWWALPDDELRFVLFWAILVALTAIPVALAEGL